MRNGRFPKSMNNHDSPAQAFLKIKSPETAPQNSLDVGRDDQWVHAQSAADFFNLLGVMSEGRESHYDGEDHSSTWDEMLWLMDQATPEGLRHSEAIGSTSWQSEKFRAATETLIAAGELGRLTPLLITAVTSLSQTMLSTHQWTGPEETPLNFAGGDLSDALWQYMDNIDDLDALDPNESTYVGDDKLVSSFSTAIESYIGEINSELNEVFAELEMPEISSIKASFESYYADLREWRDETVDKLMSTDGIEARKREKEVIENKKRDSLKYQAQRKAREVQNDLRFIYTFVIIGVIFVGVWMYLKGMI
jgi:hypothetical protein